MDMLEDGVHRQGTKLKRNEMEVAMEVSGDWIELEEEEAAALVAIEAKWKADAVKTARDNETKGKKREILPRVKKGSGGARRSKIANVPNLRSGATSRRTSGPRRISCKA